MLQPGKMQEMANETQKFQIEIAALEEIHWTGEGRTDKRDYILIYSGPEERTGHLDTGFMIHYKLKLSTSENVR
jgi:hypothetical protein